MSEQNENEYWVGECIEDVHQLLYCNYLGEKGREKLDQLHAFARSLGFRVTAENVRAYEVWKKPQPPATPEEVARFFATPTSIALRPYLYGDSDENYIASRSCLKILRMGEGVTMRDVWALGWEGVVRLKSADKGCATFLAEVFADNKLEFPSLKASIPLLAEYYSDAGHVPSGALDGWPVYVVDAADRVGNVLAWSDEDMGIIRALVASDVESDREKGLQLQKMHAAARQFATDFDEIKKA